MKETAAEKNAPDPKPNLMVRCIKSIHGLIGVPWRGVSFSTLSTGRFVLKQYICKGAESAESADTAGYTYEGTQTTA